MFCVFCEFYLYVVSLTRLTKKCTLCFTFLCTISGFPISVPLKLRTFSMEYNVIIGKSYQHGCIEVNHDLDDRLWKSEEILHVQQSSRWIREMNRPRPLSDLVRIIRSLRLRLWREEESSLQYFHL